MLVGGVQREVGREGMASHRIGPQRGRALVVGRAGVGSVYALCGVMGFEGGCLLWDCRSGLEKLFEKWKD